MLAGFPCPMLLRRTMKCQSTGILRWAILRWALIGGPNRAGTRMAINEDAAQESERRLVDSYLRLGEISHLALQRDTITKHY